MAKATTKPTRSTAPATLELTADETQALYNLLVDEKWPTNQTEANALNAIHEAMSNEDDIVYDPFND
jgi:hypothetical protein